MIARRPPRRSRCYASLTGAIFLLSVGCGFDSSAPSGTPDDPGTPDASPVDPPDAMPPAECDEPIKTVMLVGGQEPQSGSEPLVTVLLGDSVNLSAIGSCSVRGEVTYAWELGALEATEAPDADSDTLRVYPTEPGDYTITLTVSDDQGSDDPITVVGIRALPFVQIADGIQVRDVAVGGGRIWLATQQGPRYIDLDNLQAGALNVNDLGPGDEIPVDLAAVFYDETSDLVWFGRQAEDDSVWKLAVAGLSTTSVDFPGPVGQTSVRDIASLDGGIMLATQEGVLVSTDNAALEATAVTLDVAAVAENPDGGWAGANELTRLIDQLPFRPFGMGDNRILAIAGDDDQLWVGGDDKGVALFDTNGLVSSETFLTADGLPSNRVRALSLDAAGDVWAATQAGVARYKRDVEAWIPMTASAGLDGLTDLVAVSATTDGGDRVVVVAGNDGVALLGPP